ncbi:hypothetical protein [Roseicella aquatilis]|uniref:hypothetical protein n=1 Tax=Roseicella aquatilis TaxID=2527868 RepID=UPI0014053B01|nr:hypothetical protein [Roseicella aquatilis]
MTTRRLVSPIPGVAAGRPRARRPLLPLEDWGDLSLRALLYTLAMLGLLSLLGLAGPG